MLTLQSSSGRCPFDRFRSLTLPRLRLSPSPPALPGVCYKAKTVTPAPSAAAAPLPGSSREISPIGLELIEVFDGWSAKAYNDAAGYCVIGYGHVVAKKPCEESILGQFDHALSREGGLNLLKQDLSNVSSTVTSLVKTPLQDNQLDALVSLVWNIGEHNFEMSSMLKSIRNGELDAAADQFSHWSSVRGNILPGLVNRRACEEALFRGQLRTPFSQSQCQSEARARPPTGQ